MKIAIGKIGQKLIFDRTSKDATRSNNNGNLDAYKFYSLLIEKFPENEYYIFGDNDGYCSKIYNNAYDVSNERSLYDNFDNGIGIFYCGLEEFDTGLIEFIEKTKIKYYLFTTDSRCIPHKLQNLPQAIYSMANDIAKIDHMGSPWYEFIYYSPIVECLAYHTKRCNEVEKDIPVLISVSDSKEYDRVDPILKLIGKDDVPIYGRNERFYNDKRFKGEIKYEEMVGLYKRTKLSIMSPIAKKWTTSKYIECLLNDVVPLFTPDYDLENLNFNPILKNTLQLTSYYQYKKTKDLLLARDNLRKEILETLKYELEFDEMYEGKHLVEFIRGHIFDQQ